MEKPDQLKSSLLNNPNDKFNPFVPEENSKIPFNLNLLNDSHDDLITRNSIINNKNSQLKIVPFNHNEQQPINDKDLSQSLFTDCFGEIINNCANYNEIRNNFMSINELIEKVPYFKDEIIKDLKNMP